MQTKVGKVVLALLVIGLVSTPYDTLIQVARAATTSSSISDLQKRKTALEQKIKDDAAAKKQKQDEQAKLDKQIADLDGQIQGIQQKIQETQTTVNQTEAAIDDKKNEINAKEVELAHQRDQQAESLRVIYETGNPSALEVLVGSNSLSEFLTYQDYLDALEQHIEQTIETIATIKAGLETTKHELETKRAELGTLQNQQQAYKKALGNQKTEKNRLLANAKTSEQVLANQIADAQKVFADVNSELNKLQEAARKKAAEDQANGGHAKIPPGVSGVDFHMPVQYRYISCVFGCQTPFQNFHTGVDLANYAGTEIKASADGVVTHIGRLNYGYGQFVVVTHNQRYSTLYAHMQDFADGLHEGQAVSQGDILGYIGMTGWTTGPHIHFEVRDYGVPVDPLDYIQ